MESSKTRISLLPRKKCFPFLTPHRWSKRSSIPSSMEQARKQPLRQNQRRFRFKVQQVWVILRYASVLINSLSGASGSWSKSVTKSSPSWPPSPLDTMTNWPAASPDSLVGSGGGSFWGEMKKSSKPSNRFDDLKVVDELGSDDDSGTNTFLTILCQGLTCLRSFDHHNWPLWSRLTFKINLRSWVMKLNRAALESIFNSS